MAENSQTPKTDTDEPVERDGSAPVQQADAVPEYVDLVGVLADEFGISRSVARRDLLMGEVKIDGEQYTYNESGLVVSRDLVRGKTVEVKGGDTSRSYRFQVQDQ